jgi:acyl-CoA thioester hydrolase
MPRSTHATDSTPTRHTRAGNDEEKAGTARLRMELRFRDLDSLGHVSHSVYHDFLAEARVAVLSSLTSVGHTQFVLAHVELDHRHEIRHDEGFAEVVATLTAVGRSSVAIAHEVLLPDGTVAAEGSSVLVRWDPQARASREFSEAEREKLSASLASEQQPDRDDRR